MSSFARQAVPTRETPRTPERPPEAGSGNPALLVSGNAALLVHLDRARQVGDLGPGPVAEHVAHSLGFVALAAPLLAPGSCILDLGSGGGIPGLVLAVAFPDHRLTLLEGGASRAARLETAVEELGLAARVAVCARRAEEAAHDQAMHGGFDLVTARGFGPPAATAECAAGFLSAGGRLITSEPPAAGASRWPAEGLAILGLELEALVDQPFHYAVLRRTAGALDERYPRRVGVPAKRPLF